jgi:hypothetical protein
MAIRKKSTEKYTKAPLCSIERANTKCLEMTDLSVLDVPAHFLMKDDKSRNPETQIARLSNQFILDNRGLLKNYGVSIHSKYDGQSVSLSFRTTNYIGALPLLSPTSGKPDYGLIIKPRFEWAGLGPMLSVMGWKIVPTPLSLPLIPGTERKVPPWVLSSITLHRIQIMLDQMNRTFSYTEADLAAPKGNVNWNLYANRRIPYVKFLDIPCKFPDLKENDELKSGIHYTLRIILSSLQSQRTAGIFVLQLIELCQSLLSRVNNSTPRQPSGLTFQHWNNLPVRTDAFREGLQALEWTIEDRGLAGIANLQGLPWIMPMEVFFEAWVETFALQIIRHIGGQIKTGRRKETITPISWDPPYLGSQKSLLPDVIIERENDIIILDAKYKRHWEELSFNNWNNVEDEIKERHREDLLQILAYSTVSDKTNITSCLIYPCKESTWESMLARERVFHKATVYSGNRKINLVLAAIPMKTDLSVSVENLCRVFQN